MAEAVQVVNNLTIAQVRRDAPSLINTKDAGRPKVFSGKEEDFQQWARKTEAIFAGEIKESEMMLEWAADLSTEITKTAIDLECKTWSPSCTRCVQCLWTSRVSKQTTWSTTRGRTHWRRGDEYRKNDPTTRGRKRNILRTIISLVRCSLQELLAGIERWESYVGRYEKLKGKMDDEIKRAGLTLFSTPTVRRLSRMRARRS